MSDRGQTCPLCGDECKSRNHVRQHLHTHHRKFELIDACVDRSEGAVSPDPDGSVDSADRSVASPRSR